MDIQTIVDILMGSGLLGILLFYESRKRKERATARSLELENINIVIQQKDSYINDLKSEQVDLKKEKEELRAELRDARAAESKERNRVATLYKQLSTLNVEKVKMKEENAILNFYRCDTADCTDRVPPINK